MYICTFKYIIFFIMQKLQLTLILSVLSIISLPVSAQSEWTKMEKQVQIQQPDPIQNVPGSIAPVTNTVQSVLPLPTAATVVNEPLQVREGEAEYTAKRILKPGESIVFEIDGNSVKEDSSALETLPAEIESAIARTPSWLHYDLRFKFRQITNSSHRSKMVALLDGTPKQYLDEVAFQLTYLPYEVLKDSRFVNTWDWLRKNAELIYIHADSLKYVRLVEKGDTATGDWRTTTEYKIRSNGSYIWREVDPYYYYMFIVMPKIEQEGVYVTDNPSSTGQRTWGYGWREYLWSDPDSTYSYRPVGISGYKVVNSAGQYDTLRVDSVPRFGEIMQMPEYLWDEQTGIWLFLRDFKSSDHALNVLGNWCSRCIPMDVTSASDYRPSQPNHIAWKHIGNCHEDALLVAAAARTALIPLMHIGDFCDDHVWGMMHDGGDTIWHHFEFFRGGCSPSRPYYWGMTNMQPTGNYGWASSLVQGYVPDGTLFNVSDYYTKKTPASKIEFTITDANGNPVDGARMNLYSANTQYGEDKPSIRSAGYLWSDANGKIYAKVGAGKKYYMKIYHPDLGSYPETSGQVYVLMKEAVTVAGRKYNLSYAFPNNVSHSQPEAAQEKYESDKGLRLNLLAENVTVGKNPVDGQQSSFMERTKNAAGLNVYVMDESQIQGKNQALYRFKGLAEGTFDIPLPSSGKSYVVLSNDRNTVNYIEVSYAASLTDSGSFDITGITGKTAGNDLRIYPNPANNQLFVQSEEAISQIRILNVEGRIMQTAQTSVLDISGLAKGIYFIQIETSKGKYTQKFIKQ